MKSGTYMAFSFDEVALDPEIPYFIWLASWYPTKTIPFNGDFIQRHAYAMAMLHPLILIHTIHDPDSTAAEYYHVSQRHNLVEIIIYFRDKGITNSLSEKLKYNFRYYSITKKFISLLFSRIMLPRFVHVHVPMKKGRIARWIKHKWNIPYIISEHSATYLPGAEDSFFSRNPYYRFQARQIFKQALAVTNVSEAVAKILSETFHLSNISIIRNTVDESLFTIKPGHTAPFRFIHVSTMNYQKNFKGLFETFIRLSERRNDFECLFIGPVSEEVKKMVRESSGKLKIRLTGEVSYADVAGYMQQSDCLVLFSRYENFPCVIVEALCCGLTVITTAAGGAGEAIQESNGVTIPLEDQDALLKSLDEMIDQFPKYNRQAISTEAIGRYGYRPIGEAFCSLYEKYKLIGKRN